VTGVIDATLYRMVVDDLRAEVERLRSESAGWQRAAESQNRQWARKCEEVTEARAEVERLDAELADLEAKLSLVEGRSERLRGLLQDILWADERADLDEDDGGMLTEALERARKALKEVGDDTI
jgi:chromosome segregation ATPase